KELGVAMPDAKSQPETSMEAIIASISRIIAEDKHPAERRAQDQGPGETVAPAADRGAISSNTPRRSTRTARCTGSKVRLRYRARPVRQPRSLSRKPPAEWSRNRC